MCYTISLDLASERKRFPESAEFEKARGRRDRIIADLQDKAHVFG